MAPDAGWLIRRESGTAAKTELGPALARKHDGSLTFLDSVAARGRSNLRCSHGRPPGKTKSWPGAQGW